MIRAVHSAEIDILTYPDWMFPVVNRYMFPLEGRWFAKGGVNCKEEPSEGSQYPCGVEPAAGSSAKILQDLYVRRAVPPRLKIATRWCGKLLTNM